MSLATVDSLDLPEPAESSPSKVETTIWFSDIHELSLDLSDLFWTFEESFSKYTNLQDVYLGCLSWAQVFGDRSEISFPSCGTLKSTRLLDTMPSLLDHFRQSRLLPKPPYKSLCPLVHSYHPSSSL